MHLSCSKNIPPITRSFRCFALSLREVLIESQISKRRYSAYQQFEYSDSRDGFRDDELYGTRKFLVPISFLVTPSNFLYPTPLWLWLRNDEFTQKLLESLQSPWKTTLDVKSEDQTFALEPTIRQQARSKNR